MHHQPIEEGRENGHFFGFFPARSDLRLERWVETRVVACGDELRVAVCDRFLTISLLSSFLDLAETMSTLYWSEGKWKKYGKDLETALQSQEARACSE